MNAVEIEAAVSQLAEAPFDPEEFPFAFLEALRASPATTRHTVKFILATDGQSFEAENLMELMKENSDWEQRSEDFNPFMARLIFCFFAEDTNIFPKTTKGEGLFTSTVAQMSAGDASNTHTVLAEMFRAMGTPMNERQAAEIRSWANKFPYVNGGWFSPHPLTPFPKGGEGKASQT